MKKPRRRVLLTIQKCLNRNKSSKRCCRFGAKLSVKIFTRLFCFEQVFNTEIFIQHSQLQERMILAHSPLAQHTVTDDSMQILLNLTGLAPHEPKQIQRDICGFIRAKQGQCFRDNLPRNPSFWLVDHLDVVLSEYSDKSLNFRNLIFMTSPLSNSITDPLLKRNMTTCTECIC